MRILHISSSDSVGGAARSAFNLHESLLAADVDSHFFAAERTYKSKNVTGFKHGYILRRLLAIIDELPTRLYKGRSKDYPFTNNWFWWNSLQTRIRKINPDIIHLHWIGKGMLRLEQLRGYKVPIVFTMHDNYAFTGGCHLTNGCDHFTRHCGACPQLGSLKKKDLSSKNFFRKKQVFENLKILFVAPSTWMMTMARGSALLKDKKLVHLPNVPSKNFFPLDKQYSKASLGIASDKKVILFGALNSTGDKNKGFAELLGAVKILEQKRQDFEICVFGASENAVLNDFKVKINHLGYLHDDLSKRIMYSAADLTVVPSRIENLSNVIMESMSCGTPVVAFHTGGNSDLIEHAQCGLLVDQFSADALVTGIEWMLNHTDQQLVKDKALQKIAASFSRAQITSSHIEVYRTLLNG